jgi:centractin
LSGGNTQIHDFAPRLISELKKIVPKDVRLKFFVPPDRNTLCWSGGSILSNLSYFKNMWITKKEYEEEG